MRNFNRKPSSLKIHRPDTDQWLKYKYKRLKYFEAHAAKLIPMVDTQVKLYAKINRKIFQSDLARMHKRKERASPERSIFDTVLMSKSQFPAPLQYGQRKN